MKREITHLTPRRRVFQALLDIALGLGGLTLVLIAFIVMQDHQDIGPVLLVTCCGFFATGFYSSRRASAFNWVGAGLVPLGGILAGLVLRVSDVAFTDGFYAILLAATAIVATLMGVIVCALVSHRRLAVATVMALVSCAAWSP